MKDVYAAGFIKIIEPVGIENQEPMVGGLYGGWSTNGKEPTAENVYVAIHYNYVGDFVGWTYPLSTDFAWGNGTNCYWLNYSGFNGVNNEADDWYKTESRNFNEMSSLTMGDAFTNPVETHPYNLDGTNRTTYPFPGLVGLPHYGDWPTS